MTSVQTMKQYVPLQIMSSIHFYFHFLILLMSPKMQHNKNKKTHNKYLFLDLYFPKLSKSKLKVSLPSKRPKKENKAKNNKTKIIIESKSFEIYFF